MKTLLSIHIVGQLVMGMSVKCMEKRVEEIQKEGKGCRHLFCPLCLCPSNTSGLVLERLGMKYGIMVYGTSYAGCKVLH